MAREVGPGRLSLEAVAERAGISKGGLLYNFPSKSDLLKAMVAEQLKDAEDALDDILSGGGASDANPMLEFLIARADGAAGCARKPPIGFLAAVAENPELLDPARDFHAKLVDCLRKTSRDLPAALIAYLALEGLRSLDLMEMNSLRPAEREAVFEVLARLAAAPRDDPGPDTER